MEKLCKLKFGGQYRHLLRRESNAYGEGGWYVVFPIEIRPNPLAELSREHRRLEPSLDEEAAIPALQKLLD